MHKNNNILPSKIPEGSVLGINYSGMHDTAIAIVSPDGTPTFAISLERISRVKQDGRPPTDLLKGLPWERIAKVAISVEREYIVPDVLTSKFHPNLLEKPLEYDCSHAPEFLQSFDFIPVEKVFVPHHLCHASSAFWLSGFPDSTCLVYDGGMSNEEWFGGVFNATQKNGLIPIDMFSCHNYANVTRIYTAITAILGFTPLRHEGKITGLAAYGAYSSSCREIINEWFLHPEKLDGLMAWTNMYSNKEIPCLQANPLIVERLRDELKRYSRENIAAAVQGIAEEHIINLLTKIISSNGGSRNLSLSGGLFANVKINQKASEIGFNKLFVSPPMSDDGTALGAALQVASENPTFSSKPVQSMFLGPSYSKREVNQLVNENEIHFTASKNLAEEVAQLLTDGLIVAIYQGAMEFGPRALGNRTILANADDSSINMSLNKKLGRTEFMPFAPVCLEEDANRLFQDMDCVKHTAEFMTVTRNCLEDMKTLCPAVVHCDGTARPQLITLQSNPLLYKILTHYKRISGKPALVNTSFNVHEEPIICSPNDAIKGFFEAGLDVLILDGKVIELVKNRSVESKYLREKLWGKESRLKECATSKMKDKIQIEQLQNSLAARNNQQTVIKSSLQQVDQQRQALQSQCETLQAEASQHEQTLRQKEGKQQELLLSLLEKETKQQETNARLIESNNQLEQLQTELSNSHRQQTAIESSLQQIEQQRQTLQSQCETLQIEASQHEQALQQKEGKQQELLLSLLEKETKQQETNARLIESNNQLEQLQTELSNSHRQQTAIESSLQQIEQQRQTLQSQCETLQIEASQHEQALQQKEGKQQELLLSLLEKETKQQETNARLIESNNQLEQLQTELSNSHRQQTAIESSLQQIEQQRQTLQSQCETLQIEASQHEQALQQKEGKQQELLLSLLEKETKQQETNARLIESNNQLEQLQTELSNSHRQQTAIESSLQQIEQQRQALQSQCEILQSEVSQHEQVFQQKEAVIIGLSSELATAKQEVEALNKSNHQWWTMADQHSKSLIEATVKIDGLNQSSHHWWLESERLNKELGTVYHSKSWIITWPLRKISQFTQWLFYLPIKLTVWLIGLPKRIVRSVLVKAMAFAVKHPNLRKKLSVKLKKFPRMYNSLRQLALNRGLLSQEIAAPSVIQVDSKVCDSHSEQERLILQDEDIEETQEDQGVKRERNCDDVHSTMIKLANQWALGSRIDV